MMAGQPIGGSVSTPGRPRQPIPRVESEGGFESSIKGQAILNDLGSPFGKKIGPLQMFLLQNENFVQSADVPDEPVVLEQEATEAARNHSWWEYPLAFVPIVGPLIVYNQQKGRENEARGRAERPEGLALEAMRTHYKIRPFKLTLKGLLMPGESVEDSRTITHYPGQKVNHILEFIRGAHLLSYASTTTQQGIGSGFIKPLAIANFDWDKDDEKSNAAPFTLELQMIATDQNGGPSVGGEDGGEKPPKGS